MYFFFNFETSHQGQVHCLRSRFRFRERLPQRKLYFSLLGYTYIVFFVFYPPNEATHTLAKNYLYNGRYANQSCALIKKIWHGICQRVFILI